MNSKVTSESTAKKGGERLDLVVSPKMTKRAVAIFIAIAVILFGGFFSYSVVAGENYYTGQHNEYGAGQTPVDASGEAKAGGQADVGESGEAKAGGQADVGASGEAKADGQEMIDASGEDKADGQVDVDASGEAKADGQEIIDEINEAKADVQEIIDESAEAKAENQNLNFNILWFQPGMTDLFIHHHYPAGSREGGIAGNGDQVSPVTFMTGISQQLGNQYMTDPSKWQWASFDSEEHEVVSVRMEWFIPSLFDDPGSGPETGYEDLDIINPVFTFKEGGQYTLHISYTLPEKDGQAFISVIHYYDEIEEWWGTRYDEFVENEPRVIPLGLYDLRELYRREHNGERYDAIRIDVQRLSITRNFGVIYEGDALKNPLHPFTVDNTSAQLFFTVSIYYGPAAPQSKYRVTVNRSFADDTGEGYYAEGETVTINAGVSDIYTFAGWTTYYDLEFEQSGSKITNFTKIPQNVTITANWAYNGGGAGGEYVVTPPGGGGGEDVITPPGGGEEVVVIVVQPESDREVVLAALPESIEEAGMPSAVYEIIASLSYTPEQTLEQTMAFDIPSALTPNVFANITEPLLTAGPLGSWALFNLIILIAGIIFFAVAAVRAATRKMRGPDEDEDLREETGDGQGRRPAPAWLVVAGIMAIAGAPLFGFTQDIAGQLVLADMWTITHSLILTVEIIALRLYSNAMYSNRFSRDV